MNVFGRVKPKSIEDRLRNENARLRREKERLERKLAVATVRITKAKEPSLSQLKKRAWKSFSKWVRATGDGTCFTCRKLVKPGESNAGHYIDSSICGPVLNFHPRNVHVQCVTCNLWKHGNKAVYRVRMVEVYGQARVDYLDLIRTRTVGFFKPTKQYYFSIIKKYNGLLAAVNTDAGLE